MAWRSRRATLQQPNFPLFSPLASTLCTPVSPCPPNTSRDRAAPHRRQTCTTAASNRRPNKPATTAVRGSAGGGRCSKPWPMEEGPGVSSSSPYLRTTRPSGRVSCGVSVQHIGGRQSNQARGRQRTGSTGLTEQTDRGRARAKLQRGCGAASRQTSLSTAATRTGVHRQDRTRAPTSAGPGLLLPPQQVAARCRHSHQSRARRRAPFGLVY